MSKSVAVIFPVWYLILAYFQRLDFKKEKYFIFASFFLAVLRGVMSMFFQKQVIVTRPVGQMAFFERFNIFTQVFTVQIRQYFLPYDLCMRYFWKTNYGAFFYLSLVLLMLFVVIGFYYSKNQQKITIAILFFLIALFPTSNLIKAPEFQADRYYYLAIFPLSILVVSLVNRIYPKLIYVLFIWVALVLIPVNYNYQKVWKNSETLWVDILKRFPRFSFAWHHVSLYYLNKKDLVKAEVAIRKTLKFDSKNLYARYNLALLLKNTNRKEEALPYFKSLVGTEIEKNFPLRKIIQDMS